MTEDQKILFHGGWDGSRTERCPFCKFQCGYINPGVIVERYQIWDIPPHSFVLHPEEQWVARLETGSYVVGYPEQFEIYGLLENTNLV
jgi:hypothetical protein